MSPCRYRLLLRVDPRRDGRSNSPASVQIDPVKTLSDHGISGRFDEQSIEVIAHDVSGAPMVFDSSRDGYERYLLPWRFERDYRLDRGTLHFVMPNESCTLYAVYMNTVYTQARNTLVPKSPRPMLENPSAWPTALTIAVARPTFS